MTTPNRSSRLVHALLPASLASSAAVLAYAGDGPPTPLVTLEATDGAAADEAGRSAALDGDFAVLGAWLADPGGANQAGTIYAWRRDAATNTWIEEGPLVASDATAGDELGISVSIDAHASDGPVVIAGAWGADVEGDEDRGRAVVFRRAADGTWSHEDTLIDPAGGTDDEFGRSVAIDGDLAVVGAWERFSNGRGRAFVYRHDGAGSWTLVDELSPSGLAGGDGFGTSVAIDGDRIAVGAWGVDEGFFTTNVGGAWIFEPDGADSWTQTASLQADAPIESEEFGRSVALDGDRLAVGTWPFFNDGPGAVYVFERDAKAGGADDGWMQRARLTDPDGAEADYLGFSVAIEGDIVVSGAWADDVDGVTNQGSVHRFTRDRAGTWSHDAKLTFEGASASAYNGYSVGLSGEFMLAGARLDDVGANVNQGSGRILWIADLNGDGTPGEGEPTNPADLDGSGVVDGADLALLLAAWGDCGDPCIGDLNDDGVVDGADLAGLLAAWS